VYDIVIKHDGHLSARGKCRKQESQASVFNISRVFSNVQSVLSQCSTQLRLLYLLYDIIFGRQSGLIVSALLPRASGPGLSPGQGHCIVFLGKTLNSHSASNHPGV